MKGRDLLAQGMLSCGMVIATSSCSDPSVADAAPIARVSSEAETTPAWTPPRPCAEAPCPNVEVPYRRDGKSTLRSVPQRPGVPRLSREVTEVPCEVSPTYIEHSIAFLRRIRRNGRSDLVVLQGSDHLPQGARWFPERLGVGDEGSAGGSRTSLLSRAYASAATFLFTLPGREGEVAPPLDVLVSEFKQSPMWSVVRSSIAFARSPSDTAEQFPTPSSLTRFRLTGGDHASAGVISTVLCGNLDLHAADVTLTEGGDHGVAIGLRRVSDIDPVCFQTAAFLNTKDPGHGLDRRGWGYAAWSNGQEGLIEADQGQKARVEPPVAKPRPEAVEAILATRLRALLAGSDEDDGEGEEPPLVWSGDRLFPDDDPEVRVTVTGIDDVRSQDPLTHPIRASVQVATLPSEGTGAPDRVASITPWRSDAYVAQRAIASVTELADFDGDGLADLFYSFDDHGWGVVSDVFGDGAVDSELSCGLSLPERGSFCIRHAVGETALTADVRAAEGLSEVVFVAGYVDEHSRDWSALRDLPRTWSLTRLANHDGAWSLRSEAMEPAYAFAAPRFAGERAVGEDDVVLVRVDPGVNANGSPLLTSTLTRAPASLGEKIGACAARTGLFGDLSRRPSSFDACVTTTFVLPEDGRDRRWHAFPLPVASPVGVSAVRWGACESGCQRAASGVPYRYSPDDTTVFVDLSARPDGASALCVEHEGVGVVGVDVADLQIPSTSPFWRFQQQEE